MIQMSHWGQYLRKATSYLQKKLAKRQNFVWNYCWLTHTILSQSKVALGKIHRNRFGIVFTQQQISNLVFHLLNGCSPNCQKCDFSIPILLINELGGWHGECVPSYVCRLADNYPPTPPLKQKINICPTEHIKQITPSTDCQQAQIAIEIQPVWILVAANEIIIWRHTCLGAPF